MLDISVTTVVTGCKELPLVTVITDVPGDGDAEVVGGVDVVEVLDGGVDECEVNVEEEVGGMDIDVDEEVVGGPVVDVIVLLDILKVRSYLGSAAFLQNNFPYLLVPTAYNGQRLRPCFV